MNWLTWRQYRTQAIAGYAALAVLALLFLLTGIRILNTFTDSGLKACLAQVGGECEDLASAFTSQYNSLQWFLPLVIIAPALFGMFWGAPLVARELENGTHRLVWTQGVTRRRWITSKLVVTLGSAAIVSGILAFTVTWWIRPFIDSRQWSVRLSPGLFDLVGIVPMAYTVFAVALGIALGTMFRKTLPAAFTTLAVFAAVRIPIAAFLRKHYMPAKTALTPFKVEGPLIMGSRGTEWILREDLVDRTGASFGMFGLSPEIMAARCPDLISDGQLPDKLNAGKCIQRLGVHVAQTYHPGSRFWPFQWIEAGIFLALAAALVAFVIWRVKRVS